MPRPVTSLDVSINASFLYFREQGCRSPGQCSKRDRSCAGGVDPTPSATLSRQEKPPPLYRRVSAGVDGDLAERDVRGSQGTLSGGRPYEGTEPPREGLGPLLPLLAGFYPTLLLRGCDRGEVGPTSGEGRRKGCAEGRGTDVGGWGSWDVTSLDVPHPSLRFPALFSRPLFRASRI